MGACWCSCVCRRSNSLRGPLSLTVETELTKPQAEAGERQPRGVHINSVSFCVFLRIASSTGTDILVSPHICVHSTPLTAATCQLPPSHPGRGQGAFCLPPFLFSPLFTPHLLILCQTRSVADTLVNVGLLCGGFFPAVRLLSLLALSPFPILTFFPRNPNVAGHPRLLHPPPRTPQAHSPTRRRNPPHPCPVTRSFSLVRFSLDIDDPLPPRP
jgi:hypothetical protein